MKTLASLAAAVGCWGTMAQGQADRAIRFHAVPIANIALDLGGSIATVEGINPTKSTTTFIGTYATYKPKTDFESTESFADRTAKLGDGRVYLFTVGTGQSSKCDHTLKYDADKGSWLAEFKIREDDALFLTCTSTVIGSYTGTNSFGVTKRILKYRDSKTGFKHPALNQYSDEELTLPMSADSARSESKRLNLGVVIRPASKGGEWVGFASLRESPTMDAPYDTEGVAMSLNVDYMELIIYDAVTKAVLARKVLKT